jgi:hypothetical protein
MRRLKRTSVAMMVASVLAVSGCAGLTGLPSSPVTQQHPAWECSPSYAGPLASAIASLISGDPTAIVAATSIGVNTCAAEASLAAGPPAQTTTTSVSSTAVQATAPAAP